jgi:hypothetical protein
MNKFAKFEILALSMLLLSTMMQPSDARGFRGYGPRGTYGAGAGTYTGARGGVFQGAGGGFRGATGGLGGGAFRAQGAGSKVSAVLKARK